MGATDPTAPCTTVEERLAEQFYRWELRGRGWQVWDQPVEPEPPYAPFVWRAECGCAELDDGRQHTLVSGLINWLHRKITRGASASSLRAQDEDEPEPQALQARGQLVELRVHVPSDSDVDAGTVEQPTKETAPRPVAAQPPAAFKDVSETSAEPRGTVANEPEAKSELPPRRRDRRTAPEPAPLGRGGSEHRYLQNLIKQYAEGLGYRASIEEPVLGGRGVDVALSKGNISIACEISVTTDDAHEQGNVQKCLAGEVEPIVPEELWVECNAILAERKAKAKRPGRRPVNLFSGITFCHCGKKMYVPSNTPKYVCSACRNKIPVMDLEAVYYEQLKGFFLSPQEVAAHVEKADENIAKKEELLGVLRAEQEKVAAEVQRIYRLYSEGGLTPEGFGKFYRPLEEREKQLDDEVPRLQAELDVLRINNLSSDRILTEAKDLYGRWPDLTRDEKQSVVESITEKIVIGKGDIDITLCYLPTSEELTKEQRCL